jgi:outer membrane protein TolC
MQPSARRRSAARSAKIGEAVDAAREAWRIQNNRYEGGLSTYLDVLSAEDYAALYLARAGPICSRAPSRSVVALVRALGGGYLIQTQVH